MRLFIIILLLPFYSFAQTETEFRIRDINDYVKATDRSSLPVLTDKGKLMKGKKVDGTFVQSVWYDGATDSIRKICYNKDQKAYSYQHICYYRHHQLLLLRQVLLQDGKELARTNHYYYADSLLFQQRLGDSTLLSKKMPEDDNLQAIAYDMLGVSFRMLHDNKDTIRQLRH